MEMSIHVIKIRNILTLGAFPVPLVPVYNIVNVNNLVMKNTETDISNIFFSEQFMMYNV